MLSVGAEKNRKSGRAKFGRSAQKKKKKKEKEKEKLEEKKKKSGEGKAFLPRSPWPPPQTYALAFSRSSLRPP